MPLEVYTYVVTACSIVLAITLQLSYKDIWIFLSVANFQRFWLANSSLQERVKFGSLDTRVRLAQDREWPAERFSTLFELKTTRIELNKSHSKIRVNFHSFAFREYGHSKFQTSISDSCDFTPVPVNQRKRCDIFRSSPGQVLQVM